MSALKITQIGNSMGVILPKEILAKMNLEKGDTVYLTEAANGGFKLSPYDDEFERRSTTSVSYEATQGKHPRDGTASA